MTTLKKPRKPFTKQRMILEIKSLRETTINNPICKKNICKTYPTLYRYRVVNQLINLAYLIPYYRNNDKKELYKWNFHSKISLDLIDNIFNSAINHKKDELNKKLILSKNKINSEPTSKINQMETKESTIRKSRFTKERMISEINSLRESSMNQNISPTLFLTTYRTLQSYGVIKELLKQGFLKKTHFYRGCHFSWVSDKKLSEIEYDYMYQTAIKSRNSYYKVNKNKAFKIDEQNQQSKFSFEVNSKVLSEETASLKNNADYVNLKIFQHGFSTLEGVEYMIIKKTDFFELSEKIKNDITRHQLTINKLKILKDEMKRKDEKVYEMVDNYESKLATESQNYEKLKLEMLASYSSKELSKQTPLSVKPIKESKIETKPTKFLKILGIKIYEKN
jgi:hypothetical protein